MNNLIKQALAGNRRAIARLISQLEDSAETPITRSIIQQIHPHTGNAHIVGITGPPGAGKSTLVNAMALQLRQRGHTVAIIAVDPSSPFTGGSLLGDRIRMSDLYGDKGIFIRSMASRGNLGGLARTTHNVAKLFDAAGYSTILIETVGAGQAEVDIATAAHTTVVVEAPGMGDDIQTIKAGILEIADILVVNKADNPAKHTTVQALRTMLQLGHSTKTNHHGTVLVVDGVTQDQPDSTWSVPIQETVATTKQGIAQLIETLAQHASYLHSTNGWQQRTAIRTEREVMQLLTSELINHFEVSVAPSQRNKAIQAVANRTKDPYTVVAEFCTQLGFAPSYRGNVLPT